MSGAEHLVVELHGDGLLLVPQAALVVPDDRNEDLVDDITMNICREASNTSTKDTDFRLAIEYLI